MLEEREEEGHGGGVSYTFQFFPPFFGSLAACVVGESENKI
jgi:hypothetical protein